jgi:hypothetical protein
MVGGRHAFFPWAGKYMVQHSTFQIEFNKKNR